MNRRNLRKLANYLLNLPEDYKHFDMCAYCSNGNDYSPFEAKRNIYTCGTAGCALGHGPAAGIRAKKNEYWSQYSDRAFLEECTSAWYWCFDQDWASYDNTPEGAALRILYLLDFGLPEDFSEQRVSEFGKWPKLYINTYDVVEV